MKESLLRRALFSLLALCAAGHSTAHLLPAQNATLNTIDNAAYVVVSVPVSALQGVDNDGDGKLSPDELQRNNATIVEQFSVRFKVTDGENKGETVLSWLVPPQTDATETTDDHSTYVILMRRVNFARAIEHPTISTDLFGTRPGESQMTITATRNFAAVGASGVNPTASASAKTVEGLREVAILQSGARPHQFFRGPWSIVADFISVGCKHILEGIDHLLFLLTILVLSAGWRYWLAVITSFTIAHSITLALSVFNVLRLPSNVIEPCIAASIVLMGLLNLLALRQSKAPQLVARVGIVFACGLLHGFGFASAIGAMAPDTRSRIAMLAGFNVGIELGQFLFVGAGLLAIAMTGKDLTKFRPTGGKADSPGFDILPSQNKSVDQMIGVQLPRLTSGIAIFCGTVFLFQRLGVI